MNYKVDFENKTVEIYSILTTNELARILDLMAKYEREKNFETFKWKFKNAETSLSTDTQK